MNQAVLVAVIGAVSVVATGLLGYWARSKNTPADTQKAINSGFQDFMSTARGEIDDLQTHKRDCEKRVARLEQINRGLRQYIDSLVRILRLANMDIPPLNVPKLPPPDDPSIEEITWKPNGSSAV